MSKHSTDHLNNEGLKMAANAIAMAAVRGSVGSTAVEERREADGSLSQTFVTVERVADHDAAWRVSDASDSVDPISGVVLVMSGLPGRYHSHAA